MLIWSYLVGLHAKKWGRCANTHRFGYGKYLM